MTNPDNQTWWIFTFGSNQPNAGHYVKFFGTFQEARQQMVDKYGLTWAFQYSEYEWNRYKEQHPYLKLETELREEDEPDGNA